MKNIHFAAAILAAISLVSCHKDPIPTPEPEATGCYILNNGSWGGNNANIAIYNPDTKSVSPNAFAAANGQALGDLGQDMLAFGDDLYIAMNGSRIIFVTDRDLKVKKEIKIEADGSTLSPRQLASGGGKVYVTCYEGYLAEIDPTTWSVRTTPTGPNPEGVAWCNGKLYVANSGGYLPTFDNTVSVIDAATFKESGKITVNSNPNLVRVYGTDIYVSSYGNYNDLPAKIQRIDTVNGTVSDLEYQNPLSMDISSINLYILCPDGVHRYDAGKRVNAGAFITDGTSITNPYSISAGTDYVWIGSSDYVTNGDVYAFNSKTGCLEDKFDSRGINPQRIIE